MCVNSHRMLQKIEAYNVFVIKFDSVRLRLPHIKFYEMLWGERGKYEKQFQFVRPWQKTTMA